MAITYIGAAGQKRRWPAPTCPSAGDESGLLKSVLACCRPRAAWPLTGNRNRTCPGYRHATAKNWLRERLSPDLPAIRVICERHGLSTIDLRRQILGTHVVFRTGDLIVKLFCRCWPGELESWPYMILTVVDGYPAADVWPLLGPGERMGIVHQLWQFMRDLHRQPLVSGLPKDWDSYLAKRIAELDEHHQLEEPWRKWAWGKVGGSSRGIVRTATPESLVETMWGGLVS